MAKKEIIYDNLLRLLEVISLDGGRFQEYHDLIAEERRDKLITLAETIAIQKTEIKKSKVASKIHTSFENLAQTIKEFEIDYADYPDARFHEILLLIELISRLSVAIEEETDLNAEFEDGLFSLVKLEKPIYINNFIYHDAAEVKNSIILVDISNLENIHDFLEVNSIPSEIYFHLIAKVGCTDANLEKAKYVLVKNELRGNKASIWACLAIHIVKDGQLIHEPIQFDRRPSVSSHRRIISGEMYQQFNDSLIILSEYNYQKDLLDKFLRLYHVVENFMYKFPLVKLERHQEGNAFSIRDFQRMYDKISTNEISTLTKLIKKVAEQPFDGAKTFNEYYLERWRALHPDEIGDKGLINSLLKRLRITRKQHNEDVDINFDEIIADNIGKILASIVYGFRNSLVHNRETEFHLTHETLFRHPVLLDTAKRVLENFLLPVLEETLFFLIIHKNDIVWFENSTLTLYEKE